METEYSHEFKGKVIPVNYGENMPFVDYKGRPSHSGKVRRREDGKREARLELNTWVGTSAYTAVHYYARIQAYGVHSWINDADGAEHSSGGYADKGKPKEMKGLEIKIERPTDNKDIKHFKDTTDYDKTTWKYMMPKLGGWETGFWTEEESKNAAIKFFKETFGKGWVLVDPYGNDGNGEDIEEGEL